MAAKILIIGNIGSGKSTLAAELAGSLGWSVAGIDECRRALGDGSASGEAAAWASFLEQAQRPDSMILECSGTGPFAHLLRHALKGCGLPIITFWLRTPVEVCSQRVSGRTWSTPYPDFGVPLERVLPEIAAKLECEARDQRLWAGPVIELDGLLPREQLQAVALAHLRTAESVTAQGLTRAAEKDAAADLPLSVLAQRLVRWVGACADVEALFFHGSYGRGQTHPSSDFDAAFLLSPGVPIASIAQSVEREFASAILWTSTLRNGQQRVFWFGPQHRKLDLLLCHQPEELAWIAEARDVPAPRLVLAFSRPDARIKTLLAAAQEEVKWTSDELRTRANLEVEKFLLSFTASAAASKTGDDYAAYFQYNLALQQLARLIQLARGGAAYLYLPRELIAQRLTAEEAMGFRSLVGSLDRKVLATQRRRLFRFFLNLTPELNEKLGTTRTKAELTQFDDHIQESAEK